MLFFSWKDRLLKVVLLGGSRCTLLILLDAVKVPSSMFISLCTSTSSVWECLFSHMTGIIDHFSVCWLNILKFIKLTVAEVMTWLTQYPVQLPSGVFSCTGGWGTKSHFQTCFQLESTKQMQSCKTWVWNRVRWGRGRDRTQATICVDGNRRGEPAEAGSGAISLKRGSLTVWGYSSLGGSHRQDWVSHSWKLSLESFSLAFIMIFQVILYLEVNIFMLHYLEWILWACFLLYLIVWYCQISNCSGPPSLFV